MTLTRVYPDTEGAMRDYLRSVPEVAALVDRRVFLGFPATMTDASFPCITIMEVGPGAVDPGDAPLSWEMLQFDCWGPGRNKSAARQVRDVLVSVIESLGSGTMLNSSVRAVGARTFSAGYAPDPDNGQARYRVDAYVMASKVS